MSCLPFLRHHHQLWWVLQQLEKPQPVGWVVSGGAGWWHLELLRIPGRQEVRGHDISTRRSAREMPSSLYQCQCSWTGTMQRGRWYNSPVFCGTNGTVPHDAHRNSSHARPLCSPYGEKTLLCSHIPVKAHHALAQNAQFSFSAVTPAGQLCLGSLEYHIQPTECFCPLLDNRVWNTIKTEFL